MRYYVDTQTVAQTVFRKDDLCREVRTLFEDYSNRFYTSTVCIKELIHLIQSDRIRPLRKRGEYKAGQILEDVPLAGIDICGIDTRHLSTLADLPLFADHNDPNDRLIIAQAISDGVPLISTDYKFRQYIPYGLLLIENR